MSAYTAQRLDILYKVTGFDPALGQQLALVPQCVFATLNL